MCDSVVLVPVMKTVIKPPKGGSCQLMQLRSARKFPQTHDFGDFGTWKYCHWFSRLRLDEQHFPTLDPTLAQIHSEPAVAVFRVKTDGRSRPVFG